MFFQNLNYVVIAIAAVVSMGIGFVWYSPLLFSKRWMKEMGYSPEKMEEMRKGDSNSSMAKTYSFSFVFTVITTLIIASLLNSLIVTSLSGLLLVGFFMWLAFSMPISANYVMFGKDSFELFMINSGYQLVSILVTTLIIGIFG